jgi:hypothetical protein
MFVKLFSQILDSSIADDRRLRHFFTDLLLCADAEGFVMMTEPAIARRIGATLEEVTWGIGELSKPDPRSKTPDHEGRRIERVDGSGYGWHILNYEHYRALKDATQMRESTKLRVRRHRAAKKADVTLCNTEVTPCNASNAMQKEKEKERQNAEETKQPQAPPSLSARELEICSWFNRRPGTAWSAKERKAATIIQTVDDEDWQALRWYYTQSGCQFLRRDILTLLNNLPGEIDRAKNYTPPTK